MQRSRQKLSESDDSEAFGGEDDNGFIDTPEPPSRRIATVYDAVAGRIGLNGFFTPSQFQSATHKASSPEEVLLRRLNAPDELPYGFYTADEAIPDGLELPDSDLLKTIHTYVADFYGITTKGDGTVDFQSFDETALLAMGVLLEEASKEALGENGDMALVEPEGTGLALPISSIQKYSIFGKVQPPVSRSSDRDGHNDYNHDGRENSGLTDEESPRKKRRSSNAG